MKRILITGQNSYIGNSFKNYCIKKYTDKFEIDTISFRFINPLNFDFKPYDIVLCVTGIAHDVKVRDYKRANEYKNINVNLVKNIAKKSKLDGVKDFIFLSSIIVYGTKNNFLKSKVIDLKTQPNPTSIYGMSKFDAEKEILKIYSDAMILRLPMVYGENCKGNFNQLIKFAKFLPIFPKVDNKKSVIYIDNLCEFIVVCIEKNINGILFPQNIEYFNTSKTVKLIKKNIYNNNFFPILIPLKPFILILSLFTDKIDKAFGSMFYEKKLSDIGINYNIVSFTDSIKNTVGVNGCIKNI